MASQKQNIKLNEKFILTLREASAYFNIGEKALRRMAENNDGNFCLYHGNRWLFIRPKLEWYFLKIAERRDDEDQTREADYDPNSINVQ
jgi:hypothetical protein